MENHLIWDWNGTLLDDVAAAVGALGRMLAKRGVAPVTVDRYRRRFGFPVRPFYAELGVDLEKWDWDGICEDFHEFVAQEPQSVREDALAALELAALAGFRQSVLSALRQDLLDRALAENGFDRFMHRAFGTDNLDGCSKLQRGRELMAELGAGAGNVVLVGDTLHDAEVARAIGARCVLVTCGHQAPDRLVAAGCPLSGDLLGAVRIAASMCGLPAGQATGGAPS